MSHRRGRSRRRAAVALLAVVALGLGTLLAASALVPADDGGPSSAATSGRAPSSSSSRPAVPGRGAASPVDLDRLLADPAALVGRTVELRGRVHFFERCPPADHPSSLCQLSAFLTPEEVGDLQAVDLPGALVLAEGGRPVTCSEREAVRGACPGWEHRAVYRLVGTVVHQVRGGRQSEQVEIDVSSKERVRGAG